MAFKLWWISGLVIVGGFIALSFFFNWKKVSLSFLILFLLVFLWNSVSFGMYIAKHRTAFFTLSSDCAFSKGVRYVIPDFYNGEAILIPIDKDNKVTGGFLLKDLNNLGCQVQYDWNFGIIKS